MEASNMKNMVVLKNLPSNIVDEAIIILKNGKKVKKLEKIDNSKNKSRKEKNTKEKDYILKEAEMLVNGYVSKIENKENKNKQNKDLKLKYKNRHIDYKEMRKRCEYGKNNVSRRKNKKGRRNIC